MAPLSFAQFDFQLPVTPLLLFAALALLLAAWGIFTLIIRYHWKNYGTGKLEVFTMNFFYLVGSFIFMALLVILAILYFFSSGEQWSL